MDVMDLFGSTSTADIVSDVFEKVIDPLEKQEKEKNESNMREILSSAGDLGKALIEKYDSEVYVETFGNFEFKCNRRDLNIAVYNTMRNRIINYSLQCEVSECSLGAMLEGFEDEYRLHMERNLPEYQELYWKYNFTTPTELLSKLAEKPTILQNCFAIYKYYRFKEFGQMALDRFCSDLTITMQGLRKESEMIRIKANVSIDGDFYTFYNSIAKSVPNHFILLGAGDAGKSTFFKRWIAFFTGNFDHCRKDGTVRNVLWQNILYGIIWIYPYFENETYMFQDRKLLNELGKIYNKWANSSILCFTDMTGSGMPYENSEIHDILSLIVKEPEFQRCLREKVATQWFPDGLYRIFENMDHYKPPNFTPDKEDYLLFRRKTTGLVRWEGEWNGSQISISDTGGQRNERKKWRNVSDNKKYVFLVNIAEFDLLCYEDEVTNRMVESLDLFDEVLNGWYPDFDFVLVFTKIDVLKEKIKTADLSKVFPDYYGGNDYDNALEFIITKFLQVDKSNRMRIQVYFCSIFDQEEMDSIFKSISYAIPYVQVFKRRNITLSRMHDVHFRFR